MSGYSSRSSCRTFELRVRARKLHTFAPRPLLLQSFLKTIKNNRMSKTLINYIGTIAAMLLIVMVVSFAYTVVSNDFSFQNLSSVSAFGGDAGGDGGGGGESGGGCCGGDRDNGGKDDNDTTTDVCPNLSGIQTVIPSGYIKVNGQCVIDVCPNLAGAQATIPSGYTKVNGQCILIPLCVAPALATLPNVSAVVGVSFSYSIPAPTGTEPISVSVSGLPAGLSYNSQTRTIAGVPTAPGSFEVTVRSSNQCGEVSKKFTITVSTPQCPVEAPSITSALTASGVVGTSFSYTMTTTGSTTVVSAANLPSGLSFNPTTKVISGTPTSAGTFNVVLRAENQCGEKEVTLVITVSIPQCPVSPPVITSPGAASGVVGVAFSYTIVVSGTASSITVGTLPAGLSYNSVTRVISGTPTQAGSFTVSISAANQCGSDSKNVVITITGGGGSCAVPTPSITSGTSIGVLVGQQVSYTLTTSGTVSSIEFPNLPGWLTFSTSTMTLFGTPPGSGSYSVSMKVSNQCGVDEKTLTITVSTPPCTTNCGGGGFFSPTVVLSRATSSPLAAFTSIYLSQVPYTGVGDIFNTLFFILVLIGASVALAIMVVYRSAFLPLSSAFALISHRTRSGVSYFFAPPARSHGVTIANGNGSLNDSHDEEERVKAFHSDGVGESIIEGLSSMKEALIHEIPQASSEVSVSDALKRSLEARARTRSTLLSEDSHGFIIAAALGKEENALRILDQMITVAESWYPARENSYLLLDGAKTRSILFSTYVSMVPLFIRWMAEGNETKAFNFLRALNTQGHSVSDFLRAVAIELDKVYRLRTEHASGADDYTLQIVASWNKEMIEKIIGTLVGAFDGSYTSSLMSGKLALGKAIEAIKREGNGKDSPHLAQNGK